MTTSTYNIHDLAPELSTRPAGATARGRILDLLEGREEIEIDLDFSTLTPSFADECLGRLAAEVGLNEFKKRVRLIRAKESDKPLIKHVILRRCSETASA